MTDHAPENPRSTFKLLDGGTLFTGRHFWLNGEARDLMCAVGVWGWEDVTSVGTVPSSVLADMPEPKCVLFWRDSYLYLQAHFHEVQLAWRQYRKQQAVRHMFPFSGIVPFSAS